MGARMYTSLSAAAASASLAPAAAATAIGQRTAICSLAGAKQNLLLIAPMQFSDRQADKHRQELFSLRTRSPAIWRPSPHILLPAVAAAAAVVSAAAADAAAAAADAGALSDAMLFALKRYGGMDGGWRGVRAVALEGLTVSKSFYTDPLNAAD